jgi:predicted TIM-barrel fold metal-dependent hydrolase
MMIVDCDGHFTPRLVSDSIILKNWLAEYSRKKNHRYSDAEIRCRELDELGIATQIQNPMGVSLGMSYDLPITESREIMRVYNNQMNEIRRKFPRLKNNLWLALQDPMSCVDEIYRNIDEDFFAVYVNDALPWGYMLGLDRLWNVLEKEKIVWYMHFDQGIVCNLQIDKKYQKRYHDILTKCEQPWIIGIVSMIDSGLFDRYPDLRVIMAERDITWIDILGKILDIDPIPYLKHNFWFTTEPEMPGFCPMAERLGYNRILFATDWPHENDAGGANRFNDVDTVKNLDVSLETQNLIFYKNYQSLLR